MHRIDRQKAFRRTPVWLAGLTFALITTLVFHALLDESNPLRRDFLAGLGWAYGVHCYLLLEHLAGSVGYTQDYQVLLGWRLYTTILIVTAMITFLVWLTASWCLSSVLRKFGPRV